MRKFALLAGIGSAILMGSPVIAADTLQPDNLLQCLTQWSEEKLRYSNLVPSLKVFGRDDTVPWSKAVIVRDSFDGEEILIVRDHYYQPDLVNNRQTGVMSSWGMKGIHFTGYFTNRAGAVEIPVVDAKVKVGQEVFPMADVGGVFQLTPGLAQALTVSSVVTVRLKMKNGADVTFPIGEGTIKEWRAARESLKTQCLLTTKPEPVPPKKETPKVGFNPLAPGESPLAIGGRFVLNPK